MFNSKMSQYSDDDKSELVDDNKLLIKAAHSLGKSTANLRTWLVNSDSPGDKNSLRKLISFIEDAKDLINYYDPLTDTFDLQTDLLDILNLDDEESEDEEDYEEGFRLYQEAKALEDESDDLGMSILELEEANDQFNVEHQQMQVSRAFYKRSR